MKQLTIAKTIIAASVIMLTVGCGTKKKDRRDSKTPYRGTSKPGTVPEKSQQQRND